jgi:hypothetical protein
MRRSAMTHGIDVLSSRGPAPAQATDVGEARWNVHEQHGTYLASRDETSASAPNAVEVRQRCICPNKPGRFGGKPE